ncbi:MAG: phosphoribulokinase, partial [Pseudomonadota bacterium]
MAKPVKQDALLQIIRAAARGRTRLLVGIAGGPGSGKSTLAGHLAAQLGPGAAVLPMDGFHLDNAELILLGLLDRKGAPETFDAAGFVALIKRLRETQAVRYPTFDRTADCTLPDAGEIGAGTQIVLVEGNYLLLTTPPWSDLADLFDITVHLEVDRAMLLA